MAMARQAVDAPPIQEPRYSLIIAAQTLAGGDERDWADGWEYLAETCGGSDAVSYDCGVWVGVNFGALGRQLIAGDPLFIRAWDRCSTLGGQWDLATYRARAERVMKARQSYHLAREFWDGAVGNTSTYPNVALTDGTSDVLTSAAVSPTDALAMVEGAMGPSRGMVHVSPQVLVHLVAASVIRWEGGVWLTPMGNVVVSDAGYSGNGPGAAAGASQWIFGTGWVQVFLGAIVTNPADDEMASAMNSRNNTIEYVVSRLGAVRWDQCVHVAAQVNIGVPAIGQLAGPPTGVVGTPGALSASVAWVAPAVTGDTAITGYMVQTTRVSTGAVVATTADTASPLVVTGLLAGVAYTARVAAVTSDGQGPYSAPSASFTPTA